MANKYLDLDHLSRFKSKCDDAYQSKIIVYTTPIDQYIGPSGDNSETDFYLEFGDYINWCEPIVMYWTATYNNNTTKFFTIFDIINQEIITYGESGYGKLSWTYSYDGYMLGNTGNSNNQIGFIIWNRDIVNFSLVKISYHILDNSIPQGFYVES